MAVGVYHFLGGVVGRWEREGETKSGDVLEFLRWGAEVVKETIRDSLDM